MNLKDKSESRLKEDLNALEDMAESRGWQVLIEYIQEEANRAVMAMGRMGMTADEVAFRRGAIYASQNVINAPSQLLSVIATELLMRKGTAALASAGALGE